MSSDPHTSPESEASDATEISSTTSAAPEKKSSTVRTALLIGILIVAAIALFFDRQAQSKAVAAHEAVFAMTVPGKEISTSEEVRKFMGREPDATYNHEQTSGVMVEEYHYSVPWRRNIVYLYYQSAPTMRLINASLNEELPPDAL